MMTGRTVTHWLTEVAGLRLLLWVALGAWFLAQPLLAPGFTGHAHDWSYFTCHAHAAHLTYVKYHQIPLWDPYFCGGIPALGNLQNNVVAPSFVFPLLFGLLPGLKIAFLAFFIAGMEGGYRLARHLGIRGMGAVAASLAFCFSGRFVQLFNDGHPPFLTFLLAPWALLCFEKGLGSRRWILAGGGVMAIVFMEGGAVPLPFISFMLVVWAACRTVVLLATSRAEFPVHRPLATLAAMAAVAAGLSAFRLLPVLDTLYANPRIWHLDEVYSVGHVVDMLFESGTAGYTTAGSAFVGQFTAAFLVLALLARDRRVIILLAAGVLMLDMATGSDDLVGLFPAIKELPILSNLRNPFRATALVALFAALGAGCGIAIVEERLLALRGRAATAAALIVPVLCTVLVVRNVTDTTRPRLDHLFTRQPALTMDQPFRQSLGNRWYAHVWPAAGLGTLSCFEEQAFTVSPALRGDLTQEEYLSDPSAGTVTRRDWSPHGIELG
ncbi:MAG: hypothetical protein JRG91_18690, partial [Deltaproteobacteria bacterium]|nr:hypothetical protein [Deltaproteobacteria bacterium]